MSSTDPSGDGPLPVTLAERVDRACDAFEAAWRSGRRPRIEAYLDGLPAADRPTLLRELLAAELELDRAAGGVPSREDYEARFPGDAEVIAAFFGAVATPPGPASVAARDGEGRSPAPTLVPDSGSTSPGVDSTSEGAGTRVRRRPAASPPGVPSVPGYEVERELGRGGMGVVYLAREVGLNRPCALKMIRSGSLAGPRETGRFLAEAEAAAKLRHPNVVQVYSLGEWDGLPYLELEYVDGGNLAERLDGTPRPAVEAARLVQTLARAIDAAHAQGVVHRDLKPSNVLLTADGTPKVADFGLAKALGVDSGLTRTDEVLGTPSYMAPEQAGGRAKEAGPAADVYALGAVFYELLTGRPPFKAATVMETLEQVRTAEPVTPGRLVPRLARDLETVCLKCLQKEPARRYESAAALADDLERYLDGRPIRARPVGPGQRLWRWCRRNPAVAALTASVAALLVASTVGAAAAAWQFRLSAARERALAERAEANLEQARQVVEEMYAQVAFQLDDRKGMDAYQRDILQKALRFYEVFAVRQSRSPRVRFEAGRANGRVGVIQYRLGRVKEAEAALARSLEVLTPLADEPPGVPEYRETLAKTFGDLGQLYEATGRTKEAEGALDRAAATFRALVRSEPDVPAYRRGLAKVVGELGVVFILTGRPDRAEEAFGQVVAAYESLAAAHPDVPGDRLDLAKARNNLGELHRIAGRPGKAEAEYRAAVGLLERLTAGQPGVTAYQKQLAMTRNNLGELYRKGGQPGKAEDQHRKALATREALAADHPEVASYQNDLAASHLNMGIVHTNAGRVAEAEASYRKSIAIRERLAKADPGVIEYQRYQATAHNNLGSLYADAGRWDDSEAEARKAVEIFERLAQAHPDQVDCTAGLGMALANLGGTLADRGKGVEAREQFSRGVEVLRDVLRRFPDHDNARLSLGSIHLNRAQISKTEGRHADALADWDRAVPLFAGSPYARTARIGRALTLARLDDHARATEEAEAVLRGDGPPDGPVPAGIVYDAACVHALAAASALKDQRRPRAEREAASGRYAATAVGLLARARDAGYFRNPSALKGLGTDPDLDPLRPRADFRALLMDLSMPADPFAR